MKKRRTSWIGEKDSVRHPTEPEGLRECDGLRKCPCLTLLLASENSVFSSPRKLDTVRLAPVVSW